MTAPPDIASSHEMQAPNETPPLIPVPKETDDNWAENAEERLKSLDRKTMLWCMSMHALCVACVLASIVVLILRSRGVTPFRVYHDITYCVMGMGLLMVYTHVAAIRLGNLRPKIVSQLKMLRSRAEQGEPKRRLLEGVDDLEKSFSWSFWKLRMQNWN
ncbi:hypothetical protein BKA56DRAFT_607775 [Ilyonectria sp. MPI-CAGE-AT-0026]|nr:hypothetical protein BKA56DRAFT_607775 [Ilyonectria sp. MPI-CAGE-AT-0026]